MGYSLYGILEFKASTTESVAGNVIINAGINRARKEYSLSSSDLINISFISVAFNYTVFIKNIICQTNGIGIIH